MHFSSPCPCCRFHPGAEIAARMAGPAVLFGYGSQTGCAQGIAEVGSQRVRGTVPSSRVVELCRSPPATGTARRGQVSRDQESLRAPERLRKGGPRALRRAAAAVPVASSLAARSTTSSRSSRWWCSCARPRATATPRTTPQSALAGRVPGAAAIIAPPALSRSFWRHLRLRSLPAGMLQGLRFTVLALGDTNYSQFWCAAPGRTRTVARTPTPTPLVAPQPRGQAAGRAPARPRRRAHL